MNYLYMKELEAGKVYKIFSTYYSQLNGLNVIFLRKACKACKEICAPLFPYLCTYYFVINGKITELQNYGTVFEPIRNNS